MREPLEQLPATGLVVWIVRLRRSVIVIVVLGVGLLLGCSQALALSVVDALPPWFGPFGSVESSLAGSDLVYLDPYTVGSSLSLRIVSRDGRDRLLTRVRAPVSFTGSSFLLAILERTDHTLLAGAPDGPFVAVTRCAGPAELSQGGRGFALDGTVVGYLDDGCGAPGSAAQVVVRDLAKGGPSAAFAVPAGARIDDIALAGAFVAYHLQSGAQREIVEDDWQTGREVIRVADGGSRECGVAGSPNETVYDFCGLGLQPDGKLARLLGSYELTPCPIRTTGPSWLPRTPVRGASTGVAPTIRPGIA